MLSRISRDCYCVSLTLGSEIETKNHRTTMRMESVCCTMNESEFIAQILQQEMRTKYVEKKLRKDTQ